MPMSFATATALPAVTAFAQVIPLDSLRYMPRQAVSGALAFSPGTVSPGGTCSVALIADGTHTPTFSGMIEDSSSQGWLSTQYAVNNLSFWADDTTVYYAIRQAATPQLVVPAATGYTLSGPSTATVGSAIVLTLASNGVIASADTITLSDGSGGTFSPASPVIPAGSLTSVSVSYTPASAGTKSVTATNSGGLANPAALSLTASAAYALGQLLRLTSQSGLTESVDANGGYDYTAAATSASWASGYAVAGPQLASGVDGYFGGTLKALTANAIIIGLGTSSLSNYSGDTYGLFVDTGSSANWQVLGSGSTAGTTVAAAAGDIGRIRRTGSVVYAEVSKNSGSTWTTVASWSGANTGALAGRFQTSNTGSGILQPFASNSAA